MASQIVTDVTKTLVVVVAGLWVAGCAGTSIVPPELQERIERKVSFQQVKVSPLSYLGKIIVVGGTVLSVKPLKQGGTRIEVLQLPLTSDDEPYGRLMDSKGRFFAVHKEFLDPATIPVGTRLTVVGEVTGSTTAMIDEFEYVYPTCDILSLTMWPPSLPTYWFRPYPHFGVYWGPYGGSYWGPPQLSPYGWPGRR
jgi:outer membrane lipoprotein